MITREKIKELLKNWNMENENIEDFINDETNKIVENIWHIGNDYLLKTGTNINGLNINIKISKALAEANIGSSLPIITKENKDFITDDNTYFLLMKKLKGRNVKSQEIFDDESFLKAKYLGEIIGRLHLVLKKFNNEIVCNKPNLFESIRDWAIPNTKNLISLPDSFYENYLINFSNLYPDLPNQLIHRDSHPGNIIIEDGKLSGFIDFELSEQNVRIFDPCYASTALLSSCFENDFSENLSKWPTVYRSIISGYDSVCRLSEKEKQALPYIVFSIQMICFAFFNSLEKYAELAKINQKMLIWLYENKDILNFKN